MQGNEIIETELMLTKVEQNDGDHSIKILMMWLSFVITVGINTWMSYLSWQVGY